MFHGGRSRGGVICTIVCGGIVLVFAITIACIADAYHKVGHLGLKQLGLMQSPVDQRKRY